MRLTPGSSIAGLRKMLSLVLVRSTALVAMRLREDCTRIVTNRRQPPDLGLPTGNLHFQSLLLKADTSRAGELPQSLQSSSYLIRYGCGQLCEQVRTGDSRNREFDHHLRQWLGGVDALRRQAAAPWGVCP